MKVMLQSSYGEQRVVAEFDAAEPPMPNDHFLVAKRNGSGFTRCTYRVVSRVFNVVIEQRQTKSADDKPPTSLRGVVCNVVIVP